MSIIKILSIGKFILAVCYTLIDGQNWKQERQNPCVKGASDLSVLVTTETGKR
ncbi:MAG: hypothetical protein QNJ55_23195 [Xenococcus sp. MO_188.B8]|nr:hypothetical protein [Xenococcus sp. MO_188.B8]